MPRRSDARRVRGVVTALVLTACSPTDPAEPRPPPTAPTAPTVASAPEESPAPTPVEVPAAPSAPSCRELARDRAGSAARSRTLRRHASDDYALDDVWSNVSITRAPGGLRVRWWAPDRQCPLAAEVLRAEDVVILRETPDPGRRCAEVGAVLVETPITIGEGDARLCVPGRPDPIALDDLAPFERPPLEPPRRSAEAVDPWAIPRGETR